MLKDKIKILVTDDEQEILDLLRGELSDADKNFEVLTAGSGYQSLSYLQTEQIGLLITDIAMPDMDGYELYKRAKEIRPNLPIIMMTGFGYDPNHTVVNAKKLGLKDVIFKPFELEKLLSLIYKALAP